MNHSSLIDLYLKLRERWTGCQWDIWCPALSLNLRNIRSDQALLMVNATAGPERTAWYRAWRWLSQVEEDAFQARELAELAVDLCLLGQPHRALFYAQLACALEARHTEPEVWPELIEALEQERTLDMPCSVRTPVQQERGLWESQAVPLFR